MMPFFSISQHLTPQVVQIKNKKHFCFNSEQSKALAKLLEIGKYNDSLATQLSNTNVTLRIFLQKKDSVIAFQKAKLKNSATMVDNKTQSTAILLEAMQKKDRKIRRGKFHKILLTGGLIGVTTLLILQ